MTDEEYIERADNEIRDLTEKLLRTMDGYNGSICITAMRFIENHIMRAMTTPPKSNEPEPTTSTEGK